MLIIPAIDLRQAKVVRLFQGNFQQQKVYSADPVKVAKHWARQGAKLLHVVDLDGAATGVIKNLGVLKKIISQVCMPIQFGGGVRNLKTIESLLKMGLERVVLGSRAATDPEFLKKARENFRERVIVSVDAKNGLVATQGWNKKLPKTAIELARDLKKIGFKQIIYTDISKDGTLEGPNIQAIKELLKIKGLGIIASGGVSGIKDLEKLNRLSSQGLAGIIIGKALYEGKFTLRQALKYQ